MENIVQLNVKDNNQDNGFSANLEVRPLIGTTKDPFLFQLIPNDPKQIKSLIRNYGDGQSKQSDANGLKQIHSYAKA